jgi:hypothetical protein
MAVAMVLSSTTALLLVLALEASPGASSLALVHGLGLLFALYAGGALFVTRRAHGVRVAPRAAWTAVLSVGVSFPVLVWGGGLAAIPLLFVAKGITGRPWGGSSIPILGMATVASALGALWVAVTLKKLTGSAGPTLRRAMVAWGAAWPPICLFGQQAVNWALTPGSAAWRSSQQFNLPLLALAWQLPIGLASAAWFVRAGSASGPTIQRPEGIYGQSTI